MVIITFPDPKTQQEALGFLLGRFSETVVPAEAVQALAEHSFVFTVQGTADEKKVAALRSGMTRALNLRAVGRRRHR